LAKQNVPVNAMTLTGGMLRWHGPRSAGRV
jgi:hypothetical protein